MARDAVVGGIGRDIFRPAQQSEISFRHDEVEKSGPRADRTIALPRDDIFRRLHLERDPPAMTATSIEHGRAPSVWADHLALEFGFEILFQFHEIFGQRHAESFHLV